MVSLSTILCPTCPSHPSVPKRHMGHQGTSHGVPQHNSLSHLSIPSLSPQGTYGTSRDVPWCPSAQFPVPPVHPIPQSPRDIWDIKGCSMVSLSTILCPTCPSIEFPCTILYFKNVTHPTQVMYQTRIDSSVLQHSTLSHPVVYVIMLEVSVKGDK